MDISRFCVPETERVKLGDFPKEIKGGPSDKSEGAELLAENRDRMFKLQDRFYADGTESLLLVFQGMDAAGKDSVIKHVMSGVNPQGVKVVSFKQPSKTELAHDYLWRCQMALPERGHIGIFNRSHYEEVLIARVRDLPEKQPLPQRATEKIWRKRYEQIRDWENHLYQNGTTVIKFFLNISKDEQAKRFLGRIENDAKNWKFSESDIAERDLWDDYMRAFEDALNETSTSNCPWYVIPGNRKWYAKFVISEIVIAHLESINPQYPRLPDHSRDKLGLYREALMKDLGWDERKMRAEYAGIKEEEND